MWTVRISHFDSCIINDRLCSRENLVDMKLFSTKKAAIAFINDAIKYKDKSKMVIDSYSNSTKKGSYYYFSGKTWIEEDTGEKYEEYYCWTIKKKLKD